MLDNSTKRRIDSCRDMLVGKVPDPKSQVEQITLALIYKFMDDMDAEAEELGGNRTFFAGDFAQYGWAKLMAPGVGGFDLIALYGEGIAKMPENPGVPQLFRDIFKNAYLPYRDPETLRLFLKEINTFTYDHSEKLGDAFEYLLLVLGSQGDAGQFRTPRQIIDFIVEVVDPKKHETVLDPACGTAGFLIASYKHILNANAQDRPGDLLSHDERAALVASFIGYDISPDMVRLSLANLYLHGFPSPRIEEYDTLTSEDHWNTYSDVILANPPFMSPKGGIKPHKRFTVASSRSEVLFVDYIAEHLTPDGRAGVIVPEGIIFQSGGAYKTLRKMLVEKYLVAVVSLPAEVFQPYSGVKTSILLLDRPLAKASNSILFVKIASDGFGLGAQRRATAQNDLPDAARHLKAWMESLRSGAEFDADGAANLNVVEKAKIAASGDYNLSGDRYLSSVVNNTSFEIVQLAEITSLITKGTTPTSIDFNFEPRGFNFIKIESIAKDGCFLPDKFAFISGGCHDSLKRSQLQEDDVLFSIAGAFGRCAVITRDLLPANTNQALAIIRPIKTKILPKFLFLMLKSDSVLKEIQTIKTGVAQYNLSLGQVSALEIPLPPLPIQQEIVAEIEGYQKIIDGARQVVENYKPRIAIRPEWEMVEFQNAPFQIIDGDRGANYPAKEDFSPNGFCLFLNTKNVRPDGFSFGELNFITKLKDESLRKGKLECGDVIFTTRGTVGNTAHFSTRVPFEHIRINSGMIILRPDTIEILGDYLFNFLQSQNFRTQVDNIVSGSAQPQLPIRDLNLATIPLPPIETQRAIVAEIEAEQRLVDANRELIARFEAKIKAAIDRVWGAGE